MKYSSTFCISFLFCLVVMGSHAQEDLHPAEFKFDFGEGRREKGFRQISNQSLYTEKIAFGLEGVSAFTTNRRTGKKPQTDGYITSVDPFFFSVALPEGNYH